MTRAAFDALLCAARETHRGHAAVSDFCAFPTDIAPQAVAAHHMPPCDLLLGDGALDTVRYADFRDAIIGAAPLAAWRETYGDTGIGRDFLDRFGCYCIVGEGGPFRSDFIRAWIVYMPAWLHYPWHHHPAEEVYLTLAGQAEFLRLGEAPETLGPGGVSRHGPNQPHAMTTRDQPVLAYVVWRNSLDASPVLTPQADIQ